jgi:hypothetical protein
MLDLDLPLEFAFLNSSGSDSMNFAYSAASGKLQEARVQWMVSRFVGLLKSRIFVWPARDAVYQACTSRISAQSRRFVAVDVGLHRRSGRKRASAIVYFPYGEPPLPGSWCRIANSGSV